MLPVPLEHYLVVAAILFVLGVVGVMVRRNAIVTLMSWNSCSTPPLALDRVRARAQ
jgi:hypothetical protein